MRFHAYDEAGRPLAVLDVHESYEYDKQREAEAGHDGTYVYERQALN